ncbi:GNAT family protein [Compostibacter hankyongensis]|uniref:GNAT family N-acetyltransferase n=1 Tax=Compostibacter hankyongensis TaxID=1007089 RepID=A0ABP8FFN5_9BACT
MEYLLANGQKLRIRAAKREDAAALLQMFRLAVTETPFLMTDPREAEQLTLEQEEAFVDGYRQSANHLFLVADVGGGIAGSLTITQSKWFKQRHVGELGIVILRDYWNMGIGRRMINTMLQWVERHPLIRCLHLNVMAHNEKAIRIYKKFGFTEHGRLEKAALQPGDRYEDLILMSLWVPDR